LISLKQLEAINAQVNAIPYQATGSDAAEDNWIDNPQPGVVWQCRDYAIDKAKLIRQQDPEATEYMGLVLCMTEIFKDPSFPDKPADRYYHAVQYVRLSGQVYILDNRIAYPSHVVLWRPYPFDYQWLHQEMVANGVMAWRDARGGLV